MRVGVVVQARLSSVRLPGKVLRPLDGKPLLAWLLERLARLGADFRLDLPIVVATSHLSEDNAVADLAGAMNVACYRGPLDDVTARLVQAARSAGLDAFVRTNGDSPLMDPKLVALGCRLFSEGHYDLVSNVFPRSFPKGMSVEVIDVRALGRILEATNDPVDREHVTRYAYSHPDIFRIRAFAARIPRPGLQLSVDTLEDFARLDAVVRRLGPRALQAGWEEIANCADELTSEQAARH